MQGLNVGKVVPFYGLTIFNTLVFSHLRAFLPMSCHTSSSAVGSTGTPAAPFWGRSCSFLLYAA